MGPGQEVILTLSSHCSLHISHAHKARHI